MTSAPSARPIRGTTLTRSSPSLDETVGSVARPHARPVVDDGPSIPLNHLLAHLIAGAAMWIVIVTLVTELV